MKNFTLNQHPDWVALRVHSDMNTWMDAIVYVPEEAAKEAATIFSDTLSEWYANDAGIEYGQALTDAAFLECSFDVSVEFCDYDEETDEPLPSWNEKLDDLYQNRKILFDVTAFGYEKVN